MFLEQRCLKNFAPARKGILMTGSTQMGRFDVPNDYATL
jgi:hypothetical protein